MARTNSWTETLVDWVDGRLRQNRFSNLWLGGGPGANGGTNYRPVDGQLTQRHVCYDTSEGASPCSPSGFSSLVDNLRRIRYWQEPATWFGVTTSGAPPSGSSLNVYIKPGLWYPSTTEYCAFAGGHSPTFTLPGVLDRIDTVYVDPSGVLHIQRGTPAVLPTITLPPIASGIPLWAVHLTPTASGITFIECSGYYSGMGYIERDLRPFLNLEGGGAVASGVLPATTAEGQALVSNAALEWIADTTPLWKGEHSFEAGMAFVGATAENSVTIPNAQTRAYHIIDTGATEFLRIDTYNEYFLIDPAGTGVKVGIGLSVPDLSLHVHGSISVTIKLTNDDTGIAGNVGFDIGVASNESVYMWNRENTELSLGTNNTRRLTILAGGDIGIATATPEGKLDVAYGGYTGKMTLLLGADLNAITRTNNTNKRTIMGSYHYTNIEQPVAMMYAFSSSILNRLDIGGGHIYCNAATQVSIYTAANTTTTTGTERFKVDSTGAITVTGPSLEVPDEWWVGIGAALERIIFDSAGDISFMGCNVGVGVITPNQQLTVEGTIDLKEQAAANADVASYGQIWVKNTAPNELWFTDDAGTDVQLGVGGGGLPAVAGAGYALVSDGVNSWVADQTPAWTGEHSFGAAIAFTGATGINVITIPDNLVSALYIVDTGDADVYLEIVTATGFEGVVFNAGGDDVNFTVQAIGVADALSVQGSDGRIILGVLTAGYVKSSAGGILSVATEVPLIDLGSYTQGDLIYGGAADWQDLAIGEIGGFLWVNAAGTEPEWHILAAADIPAHALLGTQHSDTATDAPTRGSLIYGNATPLWDELTHPAAAGYALITDANDVAWDQTPAWTGEHSFAAGIAFTGASGANEITIPDNIAIALELLDAGGLEYMRIVSTDANPYVLFDPANTGFEVILGATANPIAVLTGRGFTVVRDGEAENNLFAFLAAGGGMVGQRYCAARGTAAAPAATQSGDGCFMGLVGYDGANFISSIRAYIGMAATQNWTAANQGSNITFHTCPNNSVARVQRMVIDQDGDIGMGTSGPAARAHVANETLANTSGQHTLYLTENNSTESATQAFDPAKPYFGVGFRRLWSGASATNVAGIYAYGSSGWKGGLVFRTKDGGGAGGAVDTTAMVIQPNGNVGMGGVIGPLAKCHIDQASTTAAIPVLILDQADVSEGFINFIGSNRGIILSNVDSLRSVRVEWNGTVYRLALYVDA